MSEDPKTHQTDLFTKPDYGRTKMVRLDTLPTNDCIPGPAPTPSFLDSVRRFGVMQPVTLREPTVKDGMLTVVAGRRRIKAARAVGLREIPARVLACDDMTAGGLAFAENWHRSHNAQVDLGILMGLAGEKKLSDEAIAEQLGVPLPRLLPLLRMLRTLIPPLRHALMIGKMKLSTAILAARLEDDDQKELVALLTDGGSIKAKDVRALRKTPGKTVSEMPADFFAKPQTPAPAASAGDGKARMLLAELVEAWTSPNADLDAINQLVLKGKEFLKEGA